MPIGFAHTIFLLSPANLAVERGKLLFNPNAGFPLAAQIRAGTASIGEVMSFVSGLYFRGKLAYARAFERPPGDLPGVLVITAGQGLCLPHEPVTLARMRAWAEVDIDADNRAYADPVEAHAVALAQAHGGQARFVLLGSVATDKYVRPLTKVFGDHLLFPGSFVGRGDMSRGALMLRAARDGQELDYQPVESAIRRGPRAPGVRARR